MQEFLELLSDRCFVLVTAWEPDVPKLRVIGCPLAGVLADT
jgi:hypothetical protein